MSDQNQAAGNAPAAPQTSAQNPPAASNSPNVGEPDWLNGRIAQAKNSAAAEARAALLAEIGASSLDEAKAIAAAAKVKADAEKSAETRAAELKAKLESEQTASAEQLAVVREHAGRMMIGLSAEQQAAVKAIAGDDPVKQLRTIGALTPTWAAKAADTSAASTATSTAVATAPATTAPPASAPIGAAPPTSPSARAQYESLRSVNPFAAAFYGANNPEAYKK